MQPEPVQLPEEEERQTGTVGLRVYVEYFKAGAGIFKFLLLVVFNIVAQVTYIMSDWWLSRWCVAHAVCVCVLCVCVSVCVCVMCVCECALYWHFCVCVCVCACDLMSACS